jgi:putative oxidoreductase
MPDHTLTRPLDALSRGLARLQPLLALGTRLYVSWVFLKSGYLKLSDWDSTLALFQYEYHVPLLPPGLAAVMGTAAELTLPLLLIVGLFGRPSALALFFVNIVAVVSYAHVLLSKGLEAAVAQHYLWGFMLLMLAIYGPGPLSVDRWLAGSRTEAASGAASSLHKV